MIAEIFAITDNGQRTGQNEDNFAVCKDLSSKNWVFKPMERLSLSEDGALMLVADGMGGANAGEVASHLAQKVIQEQFNAITSFPDTDKERTAFLKKVVLSAHEAIVAHQEQHLETAGMGTTIVLLWVTPLNAYVVWCGDSRLYIHKKGNPLHPATDDHSYVWELVRSGQLSAEDARVHPESNIITQSLGDPRHPPLPEIRVLNVAAGDRFLLCSDGLNSMLPDKQIEHVLDTEESTVEACKKLVDQANAAGGKDNITVVLFDVHAGKSKPAIDATTTQELRKYIKVKNRVISFLGLLLIGVISYMLAAKMLFPESKGKPAEETLKATPATHVPATSPQDSVTPARLSTSSLLPVYGKEGYRQGQTAAMGETAPLIESPANDKGQAPQTDSLPTLAPDSIY